ncbi:hypothetical protein ACJJTC_008840 [Scirpophaga incertulas]
MFAREAVFSLPPLPRYKIKNVFYTLLSYNLPLPLQFVNKRRRLHRVKLLASRAISSLQKCVISITRSLPHEPSLSGDAHWRTEPKQLKHGRNALLQLTREAKGKFVKVGRDQGCEGRSQALQMWRFPPSRSVNSIEGKYATLKMNEDA